MKREFLSIVLFYPLVWFVSYPFPEILGKLIPFLDLGDAYHRLVVFLLCPAAFLSLGFYFDRWRGLIIHAVIVGLTYWFARPRLALAVAQAGSRAFSWTWPDYLTKIYVLGALATLFLFFMRTRSEWKSKLIGST